MKKTFCILFIIFLICSISPIYPTQAAEIARLVFPNQKNVELLVNGETSIPPFSEQTIEYKPVSFSALTPNTISFGNTTKTVSVKKIKPDDFITLLIGAHTYRLILFPRKCPPMK